jgi:hypothetical protein
MEMGRPFFDSIPPSQFPSMESESIDIDPRFEIARQQHDDSSK